MASLILTLAAMQACVLLIPVLIIHYLRTNDGYTATARVPVDARKVFSTAVDLAREKDLQVTKKDDAGLRIEVTDGRQKGSLKVAPLAGHNSAVTVTADVPQGREEKTQERELALRVISTLCDRLGGELQDHQAVSGRDAMGKE